jgi:hypothetical protein
VSRKHRKSHGATKTQTPRVELSFPPPSGEPLPVPEVDGLDSVFGAGAMRILPAMKDIPEKFKRWGGTPWNQVVSDWFFCGLADCEWKPRAGVDTKAALRAVSCCMTSFEPSHEHKTAGCAYLLSQWFEGVTYRKKREER